MPDLESGHFHMKLILQKLNTCDRRLLPPMGVTSSTAGLRSAAEVHEILEEAVDEITFGAACRRRPRHEIEDLSVLHAVIGDSFDLFLFVEIDRQHMLVDHMRFHEA